MTITAISVVQGGAGVAGPVGARGASYGATSATSRTLTPGSKTFTTQANLAYLSGARARISSAFNVTDNWMEGIVTAYSGTTLTVTITDVSDTADGNAHTDWIINLAGAPGSAGPRGFTGDVGAAGNKIWTGTDLPSTPGTLDDAIVGDYYIRTTNHYLYGPAVANGQALDWGTPFDMRGATGATGATGAVGPSGTSALTIVRLATTANVTLASGLVNGVTIDGVVLVTGDRVLVKSQTTAAQNGIYIAAASGAASRDSSFNTYDIHCGAVLSVQEGTASADTLYRFTSNRGGTLGVTALNVSPITAVDKVPTIASATTTDLGSVPQPSIIISGSVTITSFGSSAPLGSLKNLYFSGAPLLTYGASAIRLPGLASIQTATGDCCSIRHETAGFWRVMNYQRYTGRDLNSGVTDTLTVGYTTTSYSAGTKSSGTFTPDPRLGNIQHVSNGGAHTLAPPAYVCTLLVEYTNISGAGAITTSGFTKVNGDTIDTVVDHKYLAAIAKTQNYSELTWHMLS